MIKKSILDNGLTLITERMPHVRSVALGLWIRAGSIHEKEEAGGVAHFIEHMLFKGTKTRATIEIAREVDAIGGQLDAFTTREFTCLNIHVLDEHLDRAMEIMADMVLHPLFDEKEVVKERGVILEEIKMVEDTPDELAQELFVSSLWKGHPLGRPIAGYRKTVRKIDKKILTSFYRRHFRAGNMILTAAGHLRHDRMTELTRKHLSSIKKGGRRTRDAPPEPRGRITLKNNKKLNQLNICLGLPAFGQNHKDRHACHLLNAILGGTMSSRLLQKIREEMGLAYAIFSYLVSHENAGYLMIYAGTGKTTGNRVVNLIASEMMKLKKEPVAMEELGLVKDFVKGVIFLGLESTVSRMAYLAKREIYHGTYESLDALRKSIDAVTREDILRVAEALFDRDSLNMVVLGDLSQFRRPASFTLG